MKNQEPSREQARIAHNMMLEKYQWSQPGTSSDDEREHAAYAKIAMFGIDRPLFYCANPKEGCGSSPLEEEHGTDIASYLPLYMQKFDGVVSKILHQREVRETLRGVQDSNDRHRTFGRGGGIS